MRGGEEGKEEYTEIKKVIGVHANKKHVIFEFLIGDSRTSNGFLRKEAIALAEQGELYAIVVHTKGEPYLRPKFHQTSFRQMILA